MNFYKFPVTMFVILLFGISSAHAQTYVVPPSNTTNGHVPYISDAAMVQCVSLYNKAKWLSNEMQYIQVDKYSQSSVDSYNDKVRTHANMTAAFNRDCAGKQSESAYKAAQALNKASKRTM